MLELNLVFSMARFTTTLSLAWMGEARQTSRKLDRISVYVYRAENSGAEYRDAARERAAVSKLSMLPSSKSRLDRGSTCLPAPCTPQGHAG